MVKFFGYLFIAVLFLAALVGISFLLAYPTLYLVQFVFTPQVIATVFGTFTVYKAWALNILAGFLFKSTSYNSKS